MTCWREADAQAVVHSNAAAQAIELQKPMRAEVDMLFFFVELLIILAASHSGNRRPVRPSQGEGDTATDR